MVAKTDRGSLDLVRRILNVVLNLWERGFDRLLSLTASMLELTCDGKRDAEETIVVLQAIKDGKKFRKASGETTPVAQVMNDELRNKLAIWQSRYLSMGIKKDFSNLHIPERPDGFSRLIVVVKDIKI